MRILERLLVVGVVMGVAAASSAQTAIWTSSNPNAMKSTGLLNGNADTVSINSGSTVTAGIGFYCDVLTFDETGGGLGNIETVCADLYHEYNNGNSWPDQGWYTNSGTPGTGNVFQNYSSVGFYNASSITYAGDMVSYVLNNVPSLSADQAAGLQLAAWAALYNPIGSSIDFHAQGGGYDYLTLSTGAGQETVGYITAGAAADAQTWYADGLANGEQAYFIQKNPEDYTPGQDMLSNYNGTGNFNIPKGTPGPVAALPFALGLLRARRIRRRR